MLVSSVLSEDRVSVSCEAEGLICDKSSALLRLSKLLCRGQCALGTEEILRVLTEREQLQSTGVGDGVAVPHGRFGSLDEQIGALLICPCPIEFDAIDGVPVSVLFALIGPRSAPADHLRTLAQMSRLLRDEEFRRRLAAAGAGKDAYQLITTTERELL